MRVLGYRKWVLGGIMTKRRFEPLAELISLCALGVSAVNLNEKIHRRDAEGVEKNFAKRC